MAKNGPYALTERLARARLELAKEAELERERRVNELETFLGHLRDLEKELVAAREELGRIERRMEGDDGPVRRRVELSGKESAPNGAVLMASRLVREGHSRAEVRAFLEENFHDINAGAAVKKLFAKA